MYGFTTTLTDASLDQALARTIEALKAEGFGVLSDIVMGFLDPQTMVGLVDKPEIKSVADQAEQRLRRACASLGGSATV